MTFQDIALVLDQYDMRTNPPLEDAVDIDIDVDINFTSPLGEDFWLSVSFDGTPEDFIEKFWDAYCWSFDADEHAANNIAHRGENGTPASCRALVEDAEEIDRILRGTTLALFKLKRSASE